MKTHDITILVLAGGELASKRLGPAKPQHNHPLLLPAGSSLAIDTIAAFYKRADPKFSIVAVVDQLLPLAVHLRNSGHFSIYQIEAQPHILGSIKASLKTVKTDWVIINPITTLPTGFIEFKCEIRAGKTRLIRENWSSLHQDTCGQWLFEHRDDRVSNQPTHPFTGILTAPTKSLIEVVEGLPDYASNDLIYVAEALHRQNHAVIVKTPWHDLGHRSTHAASRRSRLPSRAFNQLTYCKKRDVIIKQSSDQKRLHAEKSYLEALPIQLRRYFPTVLPGEEWESTALVMEAIPFPSLAELHLHWDLGPNTWVSILERLYDIQQDFCSAQPTQIGNSDWLFSTKLQSRWQDLIAEGSNQDCWWQRELRINGQWFPALHSQLETLITQLIHLEGNAELGLIHGDFCFNNILCDPLYTAIRLIDPRGERAPYVNLPRGTGDRRYDLAKLFHSISGHYDAIVNNLFQVQWHSSQEIEIQVYVPTHQPFLQKEFEKIFLTADFSLRELQLLTASLFFSMLPLHQEDQDRVIALAHRGMLMLQSATH
ncbi:hypothetical protein N9S87_00505 [Synechococcus sp. AH-779-G23]|nr:hypothetical protein [Synechococcus sp. AH-779-G23]MDA9638946.1 hypothetical protein [Synechococcus sp. AH-779-G23]